MRWAIQFMDSEYLSSGYKYGMNHPEVVLLVGLMFFLLLRGKFRPALILAFGAALCLANVFIFAQYRFSAIPLAYAVCFAGISIVLLLLLVYQFIQTA